MNKIKDTMKNVPKAIIFIKIEKSFLVTTRTSMKKIIIEQ